MKCTICKNGDTRKGVTSITLQRDGATFVVRDVPADICQNCGEAYVSQNVSRTLLKRCELSLKSGVLVNISEYDGSGDAN